MQLAIDAKKVKAFRSVLECVIYACTLCTMNESNVRVFERSKDRAIERSNPSRSSSAEATECIGLAREALAHSQRSGSQSGESTAHNAVEWLPKSF